MAGEGELEAGCTFITVRGCQGLCEEYIYGAVVSSWSLARMAGAHGAFKLMVSHYTER